MGEGFITFIKDGTKMTLTETWGDIFKDTMTKDRWESLYEQGFITIDKNKDCSKVLIERSSGGLGDILMLKSSIDQIIKNYELDFSIVLPGIYAWMFNDLPNNARFIDYNLYCQNYMQNIKDIGIRYNLQCPCISHKIENNWKPVKNRIEIFAETLGVLPKKPTLSINTKYLDSRFKKNGDNRKLIGLVLRTADRSRPYPMQNWVNLAKELNKLGNRVVSIDENQSIIGYEAIVGQSLERVCSIISQFDLIITADTGLLHVAAVHNVPIIGLFGCTNGKLINKMYDNVTVLQHLTGGTTCYRPCYANTQINNYCCANQSYSTCMYEINIEEIINAVNNK